MSLKKSKNFSRDKLANLVVGNGDTFESCNFSQPIPHTKICEGYTGLTFVSCNLANCDVPPDAVVENCGVRQKSRCSHLHPEWGLSECIEDCIHVVDTDEVWIDGQLVEIIYHYEDKAI